MWVVVVVGVGGVVGRDEDSISWRQRKSSENRRKKTTVLHWPGTVLKIVTQGKEVSTQTMVHGVTN